MILDRIEIKNFRSIESLKIDPKELKDGSKTFALIGVNEAGKSSILRAISLKDSQFQVTSKDYKNPDEEITICFDYKITADDQNWLSTITFESTESDQNKSWTDLSYTLIYKPNDQKQYLNITLRQAGTLAEETIKEADLAGSDFHDTVYWTSDDKYLISKPIQLSQFAIDNNLSIPLKNCFSLAGYDDIASTIKKGLSELPEKSLLQDNLSEATTNHIKQVWPDHPIDIRFEIDNGIIHFLIRDNGVKKPKTTDQRSDGFRQFISFLLTISAEDKGGSLSNKILLLDEPETHLHPQAQINLLDELKKITSNDRNNFVLFATHSGFMIDTDHLERNYRVSKTQDTSKIDQFKQDQSTYAKIMYEVFEIPSKDYHSELFTELHFKFLDEEAESGKPYNTGLKHFDQQFFNGKHKLKKDHPYDGNEKSSTLPTYIRNCINHPGQYDYSYEDLVRSIKLMRNILGLSK